MNTVHVINLKNRVDRLEHFKVQAAEQGFEYKIWEGIPHFKPFVGIAKAHKRVVQHAKDNNLPYIIICEDDINFSDKGAFDYFISKMPTDFDLFIGVIYHGHIRPDNTVLEFSSLILYIIHSRFYDTFLSVPEKSNIDRELKLLGKFVVCNPFVCKQTGGYSDNSRSMVDEIEQDKKYMGNRKFFRSVL